jgi:nucleoside-diphosphate-sugar epimerase
MNDDTTETAMIIVTGGTGFVGQALTAALQADGRSVRPISRRPVAGFSAVGEITGVTDWRAALHGVDAIVHLAARVHVMNDTEADPLAAFRRTNVEGTLNLARQAVEAGVRRFVFVSSIKVNGEETEGDRIYRPDDRPNPQDPYGVSKYEAEIGLRDIARQSRLEVVIVRPPLIYGPGVRANFAALMKAVARGLPLPLGAVTDNRRSLIAVDNLCSLLIRCIDHPNAAGQTFLASDGEDLSTAGLLTRLGTAMGRPARLIPLPVPILRAAAGLIGKGAVAQRLLGSLRIDASQTRAVLDWQPSITVDAGLKRAVSGL